MVLAAIIKSAPIARWPTGNFPTKRLRSRHFSACRMSVSSRPGRRRFALIPSAGTGTRAGGDLPKQYQPLAGRPMLWHTVQAFLASAAIDRVVVVTSPGAP
ncbi:2-C-methyl-D-erythritol 4-phosphate cytidylyltransferase, partial [Ralstonia pseudosolanacearum]